MRAEYPKGSPLIQVPLIRGGKVPLVHRWSSLPADSPVWADTFAAHPGCNVGIRLDHLVVIDCDSPAAVQAWLDQDCHTDFVSRGRPERRSFWYRLPADADIRPVKRPGLEVRTGAGQQCVVPPSIHPDTGQPYEWLGPPVDEEHWREVPEAPLGAIGRMKMLFREPEFEGDQGYSVIERGGRNNFLTSLAGLARRHGFELDTIHGMLAGVNQRMCAPPLPDDELWAIARSVCRYAPGEIVLDFEEDPVDDAARQALREMGL